MVLYQTLFLEVHQPCEINYPNVWMRKWWHREDDHLESEETGTEWYPRPQVSWRLDLFSLFDPPAKELALHFPKHVSWCVNFPQMLFILCKRRFHFETSSISSHSWALSSQVTSGETSLGSPHLLCALTALCPSHIKHIIQFVICCLCHSLDNQRMSLLFINTCSAFYV